MKRIPDNHETTVRTGVTLTEVLMSMMIMSIGVSLVATLFPIAALRSAQATKHTNAAILKYNVEAQLRAQPWIVYDPDGDYATAANAAAAQAALTEHFRRPGDRNYIIDPVGYYSQAQLTDGFPNSFGNFYNTGSSAVEPSNRLQRFDAGLLAANPTLNSAILRAMATRMTKLGDSWETVVDTIAESGVAGASGLIGVNLPDDVDLTDFANVDSESYFGRLNFDPENTRVTVFSVNGQFSESYPLTQIVSARQILWTEEGLADYNGSGSVDRRYLPAVFGGAIGRVVIQLNRTNDFNWLLTVRRGGDGRASGVDVVVMYNDGIQPSDERVFETPAGEGFVVGDFDITVPKLTVDGIEPFVKRGGFVLDVDNARWYRVSNYQDDPLNSDFILVTLEKSAVKSSPGGIGHAIFLPTIVEVFPLGSLPIPDVLARNF